VGRAQHNGDHGIGRAVVCVIEHCQGDAVAIMMANQPTTAAAGRATGSHSAKDTTRSTASCRQRHPNAAECDRQAMFRFRAS
jgi:hypothetical protein